MKIKRGFLWIKYFSDRVITDNVGVFAAQASFFLIISAIPFIMLLLTLAQYVLPFSMGEVLRAVRSITPPIAEELVTTVVGELFNKTASISILSVTAISTLWSASRGITALRQGLDNIYQQSDASYVRVRLSAFGYTLSFIVVLLLTLAVMFLGRSADRLLNVRLPVLHQGLAFILRAKWFFYIIGMALFFTLIYTFLPGRKNRFAGQIPGALFASVGWLGFSWGYAIYIQNFSNFSYVYGSLAAVVLMMLWLYFCMNIFLWGAEFNELMAERKHCTLPHPQTKEER